MLKCLRSKISIQLFASFSIVLLFSTGFLIYYSVSQVEHFGKISADSNEKQIREHVTGFLSRITHEQAMRYETFFESISRASAMIASQAAIYLENQSFYASTSPKPNEPLSVYPSNGIFSNNSHSKTMVLYWGGSVISSEAREEISALSHIDTLLKTFKNYFTESVACYVATEEGQGRYYPNRNGITNIPPSSSFDIRNAAWYSIANPSNNPARKTRWSNIYQDSTGQGLLTTASTPIYSKKGRFLGAAGIDMTLDTIGNDILSNTPSCHKLENVYSFLIDHRGRFIAFPLNFLDMVKIHLDSEKLKKASAILEHTLLDSSIPEVRQLGRIMIKQPHHISAVRLKNENYFFSSHIMPSTGWRLGLFVPESNVLASVRETRKNIDVTTGKMAGNLILVSIVFLLAAIIIIGVVSLMFFINPLRQLAKGASQVRRGDLSVRVPVKTQNEIGYLAEAFNNMVEALQKAEKRRKRYSDRLERKVKERTNALWIKNDEQKRTVKSLETEICVRRKAEQDLRKSEEKYRDISRMLRLLCDNVPDMIWAKDLNKCFTFVNKAICDNLLNAADTSEPIGKTDLFFAQRERNSHPEDSGWHTFGEICQDSDAITMKRGFPGKFDEFGNVQGKFLFLSVHKAPFFNEKGKMIGTVGSARDITERKQIENQLRQARKMESIGTMASGIAHDFNNILQLVTGSAELAMEDLPDRHPAQFFLEEIKSAGLRAAAIVKQLLNFSRRSEREFRPVEVVSVVKDALKFLGSTLPAAIDVRKHFPDTEILVMGDPVQIHQVMMNLCINASQAMETSGGIITIAVNKIFVDTEKALSHPELESGDYLEMVIADTGPGISPDIMDRIFDPYFTTKPVGEGSGLGLSVVHGIIKNHNGVITVDGRPGRGAVFTILLPVVKVPLPVEEEGPDIIPRGNGERILFVEDEMSLARLGEKMLLSLGYSAAASNLPTEALKLFEADPSAFDLIITDMTMPEMAGDKLSEKIKEIRPDIPVIILTGHSARMGEKTARSLNIEGFVMKPIQMKDMAVAIQKGLKKAEDKR